MSSSQKPSRKRATQPSLRRVDSVWDELHQMREAVMRRAHEIFHRRGGADGLDLDDWLQAERELTWSPPVEVTRKDGQLIVRAALAGFESGDLSVQVTSEDVLIQSSRVHQEEDGETVYRCEFGQGRLFRDVPLPVAIDPERAAAEYKNGLLSITAPVTDASRSRRIEVSGA